MGSWPVGSVQRAVALVNGNGRAERRLKRCLEGVILRRILFVRGSMGGNLVMKNAGKMCIRFLGGLGKMDTCFAICAVPSWETKEGEVITTFCFMVRISRPKASEVIGNRVYPTRELLENEICGMLQSMLSNKMAGNVQVSAMALDLIET